ncbi:MAG TPA: class I SAM-dependent methyltransferase [Candidatus Binatus sp.]|nr:class I SAM-dependent methyltransferase [Candidatus Binatus sp.]
MDLIPDAVRAVMARLEVADAADRDDGTPQFKRLRQIRPEVGELLLSLALAIDAKVVIEIGTSGGYSSLWFAVAMARTGGRVTTFEVDPDKVATARRSFADAGVTERVELRHEDGVAGLAGYRDATADLVFLDAEKDLYDRMLDDAIRVLRPRGLLVADNLISHESALTGFRDRARADPRLAGLVVPIGRGELLAVRL